MLKRMALKVINTAVSLLSCSNVIFTKSADVSQNAISLYFPMM